MSTASQSDLKHEDFKPEDKALLRLARTPIEDRRPRNSSGQIFVWKEGSVVVVRKNETLDRVFKKLTVENFLSCPVVDDTISSQYCGVIDILDLVTFTVDVLFAGESNAAWLDFWQKSQKFKETQVWEVLKHNRKATGRGPHDIYHTLGEGFSLLHAFEVLSQSGCHRVPVVNALNRICGIYTESMAISDIRQSLHLFGALPDMRVRDMKQSDCVFAIKETDKAIDAFRKMVELDVSGLPIVDHEGVLIGSVSIRDLRGVGTSGEHFSRLFWNVKEYKDQARKEFPACAPSTHWTTQSLPRSARYVTQNDTFSDVIRAFNDGNLHRIYVVSQESADRGMPIVTGVIAQRDIISQVLLSLGTLSRDAFM